MSSLLSPLFCLKPGGTAWRGGDRENRTACLGQPTAEVGLTSCQLPREQRGKRGGRVRASEQPPRVQQTLRTESALSKGGGREEETFRVPWGQLRDSCRF